MYLYFGNSVVVCVFRKLKKRGHLLNILSLIRFNDLIYFGKCPISWDTSVGFKCKRSIFTHSYELRKLFCAHSIRTSVGKYFFA